MRRILMSIVVLLAAAGLATGCLSQSHVIPPTDLNALAQSDPQTRGQRVRVIQGLATEDEPPAAPYADRGGNVSVVVVNPVRVRTVSRPRPTSAKSKADDARVWIILAAAVAVGAAATEGSRYDGWVQLHPMHPVHLYGWDGSYTWMPLAHVTPEVAAQTQKAIVRESEGPWSPLGRAPLSRRGWTYTMTLGSSEVPSRNSPDERGFIAHIQFGRFVTQSVGIVVDQSLGWANNEFGETLYDSRTSLELDVLPLSAGSFHAGGFGQIGLGYRLDDTIEGKDKSGYLLSAGAILQLEITTRLAITARAGITQMFDSRMGDFTLGVSIY